MGRETIALLQERFRELQRVKAMREQREVSRTLALSEQNKHSMHYKPAEAVRLFLHPSTSNHHHYHHHLQQVQLAHGHVPSPPSSLSLWPTLHLHKRKHNEEEYYIHNNKRRRRSVNETSLLINLWPGLAVDTDTSSSSSSSVRTCSWNKLETSDCDSDDVDTSLHL